MLFDSLGLPKDNGAGDLQDSARLAGLLTTFEWPRNIDLTRYVLTSVSPNKYTRHPLEIKYDFSRDQTICLVAGLYFQKRINFVSKKFVDGRDFFSPSQSGHIRACQGYKYKWYQSLWLWLDVFWSAYIQPTYEPNQLLCMLIVAEKSQSTNHLKVWLKINKKWEQAIKDYWCGWRKEPELAEHMIAFLKK